MTKLLLQPLGNIRDQTKSVRHGQKTIPLMKRWANHAITLLLLSALIVAGISVYYTRQEWREMYMKVMKHR